MNTEVLVVDGKETQDGCTSYRAFFCIACGKGFD